MASRQLQAQLEASAQPPASQAGRGAGGDAPWALASHAGSMASPAAAGSAPRAAQEATPAGLTAAGRRPKGASTGASPELSPGRAQELLAAGVMSKRWVRTSTSGAEGSQQGGEGGGAVAAHASSQGVQQATPPAPQPPVGTGRSSLRSLLRKW